MPIELRRNTYRAHDRDFEFPVYYVLYQFDDVYHCIYSATNPYSRIKVALSINSYLHIIKKICEGHWRLLRDKSFVFYDLHTNKMYPYLQSGYYQLHQVGVVSDGDMASFKSLITEEATPYQVPDGILKLFETLIGEPSKNHGYFSAKEIDLRKFPDHLRGSGT